MSKQPDTPTAGELVPVKFSRLTRRGILLGLSLAQLVTLAIGGVTLVGAFYFGGGLLLTYTAPIWVLAAVLTWTPVAGRPMVEWLPVACWWMWRATGGQLLPAQDRRPASGRNRAAPSATRRLREYTGPRHRRRDDPRPLPSDPHRGGVK
ncbi:MAG: PrgI family protein [Propionibacteriaceae bacterium]|nr:PrgI family protein [Propionibacteriaceae bacterium]